MARGSVFAGLLVAAWTSEAFVHPRALAMKRHRHITFDGPTPEADVNSAASELERFFFDRCEIFVKSGTGGKGAMSSVGKRPAGGSGGAGGSVIIECSADENTLAHLPGKKYHGDKGDDGFRRETGADGKPCIIHVPPNCIITARDTNVTLGTLIRPGDRFLVCRGGEGGKGNGASGKPDKVSPPSGGTKLWLTLQMTLVADVGLLGFPTRASPLYCARSRGRGPRWPTTPSPPSSQISGFATSSAFEIRSRARPS